MSSKGRRPRTTNPGPRTNKFSRGGQEKPYTQVDGVYKKHRMTHISTSLIGSVVQIQVKNGVVYEGIFQTFSPKMEIVLELAHRIDETVQNNSVPSRESLIEKVIFKPVDIVTMSAANVDLEFANRDSFTDSAITNKANGQLQAKELEPWIGDGEEDPLTLDLPDANGWDAAEMFKTNAEQFNVKSTYDKSLKDYTTALESKETEEYKERQAEAERLAQEIEKNPTYRHHVELENGDDDEEDKFSAVIRPENNNSQTPGTVVGGKYVPPQLRKQPLQGRTGRAAGPAPGPPTLNKDSLEENGERKPISVNSETNDKTNSPVMEKANVEITVSSDVSQVESKPESSPSPQHHSPANKDKKKNRDTEIQELRHFSSNFKLSDNDKKSEDKKTPSSETTEERKDVDRQPQKEELANQMKDKPENKVPEVKSTLNPNAKPFQPGSLSAGPSMFKSKPQPVMSHTQTPTPPRAQAQSPGVAQTLPAMHGQYIHQGAYQHNVMMQPGGMFQMGAQQLAPTPQPVRLQTKKSVSVSVQQSDYTPSAQAVSGTPLMAQGPYNTVYMPPITNSALSYQQVRGQTQPPQTVMQMGNHRMINPQNVQMMTSHQGLNQVQQSTMFVPSMTPMVQAQHQQQQQQHHNPTHYAPHHASRATPPQSQTSHPAPSPATQQPQQPHAHHQGHPPSSVTPTQMMYQHNTQMPQQGHPPLQPSPHTPTSPQAVQPPNMTVPYSYASYNPAQHMSMSVAHIPHTHTVSYGGSHPHSQSQPNPQQPHVQLYMPQAPHGNLAAQPGQQLQGHPQLQGHIPGHAPLHAQGHPIAPQSGMGGVNIPGGHPTMHYQTHQIHTPNHPPTVQAFQHSQ